LNKAGFEDIYAERLNAVFEYNSAEDLYSISTSNSSSFIAMLANETKSRQDEIWNNVTDGAKKYSDESGHVKLSNEIICIVGRK
jgi:hypothetical protein